MENAILYQVNSNDELEYNGVHKAAIGANVAVTDKTDNGIDSLAALQAVMGVADAPAAVHSYLPGERTLGKAVTANLVVDGDKYDMTIFEPEEILEGIENLAGGNK